RTRRKGRKGREIHEKPADWLRAGFELLEFRIRRMLKGAGGFAVECLGNRVAGLSRRDREGEIVLLVPPTDVRSGRIVGDPDLASPRLLDLPCCRSVQRRDPPDDSLEDGVARGPANHDDHTLRLRRLGVLQIADGKTSIQEVREQGNELLAGKRCPLRGAKALI